MKYIGARLIITTFRVTTLSSLVVILLLFFYDPNQFPRSVLLTFWFVSNVLLIVSRFIFKGILYSWDSFQLDKKNVIVYGAGKAGVQISESLKKSNEFRVVGFIDDDETEVAANCPIEFSLKKKKFGPFNNEQVSVPKFAAVYMMCKGIASSV